MFKVGDKVRCIDTKPRPDDYFKELTTHDVYTVADTFVRSIGGEYIDIEELGEAFPVSRFELVTEKENTVQTEKQQHKHREFIIAWANGAEIECKDDKVNWFETKNPSWCLSMQYRVKPEPKPDQSRNMFVELHPRLDNAYNKPNLKLTFDGETGKLKSTEIIDND